jgi:hypothetical protein
MKEGLLWYDDSSQRDLGEKVRLAARRYKRKFGVSPDVCYVHPSALNTPHPPTPDSPAPGPDSLTQDGDGNGAAGLAQVQGVRISSRSSVLRHHFWVGQEELLEKG